MLKMYFYFISFCIIGFMLKSRSCGNVNYVMLYCKSNYSDYSFIVSSS